MGGGRTWEGRGGHQDGSAGKGNGYQVDDLNSILGTYSLESCPPTSTGIRNKQMKDIFKSENSKWTPPPPSLVFVDTERPPGSVMVLKSSNSHGPNERLRMGINRS